MEHERFDGKAHILVIEDNPGDVELLRIALTGACVDCEMTVLTDGAEALAYARQEGPDGSGRKPDLAIVDLNMPKNDGVEILEAIRGNPRLRSMAIAVMSSSEAPRDRATVEKYHVKRFITKPTDLDEFLKIGWLVKEILEEPTAPRGAAPGVL